MLDNGHKSVDGTIFIWNTQGMTDQSLREYIQKARAQNMTDQDIFQSLATQGWDIQSINNALYTNSSSSGLRPPMPPLTAPAPGISSPPQNKPALDPGATWDAFEHVLMFISLYVTVFSLGYLLHYLVDRWIPAIAVTTNIYDSLRGGTLIVPTTHYGTSIVPTSIVYAEAAIIVVLPIFAILFHNITKRTVLKPQIRHLSARRALIYITLLITFLVLLQQLISSVYSFLSGNVSMNMLLHLLVNVSIAGVIFSYYIAQVMGDRRALE